MDMKIDPTQEGDFGIEDENTDIIRAKWSMDGAKTLSEAAFMLREYADNIAHLEEEGWQLTQPVEDDYGFIEKKS